MFSPESPTEADIAEAVERILPPLRIKRVLHYTRTDADSANVVSDAACFLADLRKTGDQPECGDLRCAAHTLHRVMMTATLDATQHPPELRPLFVLLQKVRSLSEAVRDFVSLALCGERNASELWYLGVDG